MRRCQTEGPFRLVPPEVWEGLRYEIARSELEYDDNWRAYRYDDKYLLGAFRAAERRGCCGYFQSHVIDNKGRKWIVGCNHGH